MDMNDASVGILPGDAGRLQIAVHDPQQTGENIEHRIGAIFSSDPRPQFGGQV